MSYRLSIHPPHFRKQGGSITAFADQLSAAQMQPDAIIQTVGRRIVFTRLDRCRHALFDFIIGLVRIEESAAKRRSVMHDTSAIEIPMTVPLAISCRDKSGVRLIDQGAQVLLGPGENVLFLVVPM